MKTLIIPFESLESSEHQQLTKDGQPYAPIRYKEIVRECYVISRNINTSYTDLLDITPSEREYLLEFIKEESDNFKKSREESRQKHQKGR